MASATSARSRRVVCSAAQAPCARVARRGAPGRVWWNPRSLRCRLRSCHSRSRSRCGASPPSSSGGGEGLGKGVDRNFLATQLRAAVLAEDFEEAARLRDLLQGRNAGDGGGRDVKASKSVGATAASLSGILCDENAGWPQLGIPDWLVDRLDSLDMPVPTAIQAQATRVISNCDSDCCLSSATGSGKSIGIAVPMLTSLNFSLFEVETLVRNGASQLLNPIAMIVVPSRELGAQMALLLYKLLGGQTSRTLEGFVPGSRQNMFKYRGPKNVKVIGLLSERDVVNAKENCLLEGVQFVVACPQFARAAIEDNSLDPTYLRFLGVDEIDLCLGKYEEDMEIILNGRRNLPQQTTVFAGASMDEAQIMKAIARGWLRQPLLVTESSISAISSRGFDPDAEIDVVDMDPVTRSLEAGGEVPAFSSVASSSSSSSAAGAAADGLEVDRFMPPVPPGIKHKVLRALPGRELLMLARLLESDRENLHKNVSLEKTVTVMRSIVFMRDETAIREAAHRLRNLIWNKWAMELLLPDSGYDSLAAAEHFAKGSANLLITTMVAARGLDFPSVNHVYSIGLPGEGSSMRPSRDYLHRAGRIGRIGSYAGEGTVTTIVTSDEDVEEMQNIAEELGIGAMEVVDPSFLESAAGTASCDDEVSDEQRLHLEELFQLVESTPESDRLERLFGISDTPPTTTTSDDDNAGEDGD